MRKRRYRVTKRGYAVFGSLGLCMILALAMAIKPQVKDFGAKPVNQSTANTQAAKDSKLPAASNPVSGENNQTSALSKPEVDQVLSQAAVTVLFKPDKYDLDSEYYAALAKIVETSLRFKEAKIIIDGHYNDQPRGVRTPFREALAQNRAEVVEAYLVSQGIAQNRIKVVNKGASEPVNQDESWQEIEKNRRVVVKFKSPE